MLECPLATWKAMQRGSSPPSIITTTIIIIIVVVTDLPPVVPRLRLVTKQTNGNYGLLEFWSHDTDDWKTLCAHDWTSVNSRLACEELGFTRWRTPASLIQLRGFKMAPMDTRRVVCSERDSDLSTCLEKDHEISKSCSRDSFPVALVCSAGEPSHVGLLPVPYVTSGVLTYGREEKAQVVADGLNWSVELDRLLSHNLGHTHCGHELLRTNLTLEVVRFWCPREATSLDDCRTIQEPGQVFVKVTCYTNFDLLLAGRVEYSEVMREPTNFSLSVDFDEVMQVSVKVTSRGANASCEVIRVHTDRERSARNYLEGTPNSSFEIKVFPDVSSLVVVYTSACPAGKRPMTSFSVRVFKMSHEKSSTLDPNESQSESETAYGYFASIFVFCLVVILWPRGRIKRLEVAKF